MGGWQEGGGRERGRPSQTEGDPAERTPKKDRAGELGRQDPRGWELRDRERGERGSTARQRGPHKMRDSDVRMPGTPRRAQRATDRGAGVSGP